MRVLHLLLVFVCALLFVGVARATRINIQDPGGLITPVTTSPFSVTFSDSCSVLLPNGGSGEMGCFGFLNRTGSAWTSLELVLTTSSPTFNFTCNDSPSGTPVFATVTSCGYNRASGAYELTYTDGSLPNGTNQYFVISEDDLPPDTLSFQAFPTFATTPEPGSLLLMASGAVSAMGLLRSRRRRSAAC